jgi:hypothetical protein
MWCPDNSTFHLQSTGGIRVNRLYIALLAILFVGMAPHNLLAAPQDNAKAVVLVVDHRPSGFTYEINSKPVKGDLLMALTKLYPDQASKGSKCFLLVNETFTISMINNLLGIMAKAGFVHPRTFFFARDRESMIEFTYSKAVPFSTGNLPQ